MEGGFDIDLDQLMDVCDDMPDLATAIDGELNETQKNNVGAMEIEMEALEEQISNEL